MFRCADHSDFSWYFTARMGDVSNHNGFCKRLGCPWDRLPDARRPGFVRSGVLFLHRRLCVRADGKLGWNLRYISVEVLNRKTDLYGLQGPVKRR